QHIQLGSGMYGLQKEQLETFRHSIVHPRSGKALVAAVGAVTSKGKYEIGGKTRKLMPRGFEADPSRADYLLYEGLYATATLKPEAALKPDFVTVCLKHFKNTWPIGKWLLEEVTP
ncbi:MAG: DUF2461 family protein, partial [Devosia sp.]